MLYVKMSINRIKMPSTITPPIVNIKVHRIHRCVD